MGKKPVIGLLGGGQLGRMLQEQAALLGIEILVLDEAGSPTKQINQNDRHVTGSFKDPDKIRELARRCDVLTVEIEHINTDVLEEIATKGVEVDGKTKKVPVHPSWDTLRLIQDKYLQKEHFGKAGIPIAPQIAVESGVSMQESLQHAADKFGFPFMLKARKGSYDGRGNFKINGPEDFAEAINDMGKLSLYAEKFQPFTKELAVMVIRTEDNEGNLKDVYPYPAVETIHEESICTKVFYPPRGVSKDVSEKAKKVASDVIRTVKGRGVFAVEMFLLENDELVINEVAPRPHNSGHYTIEAVPYFSQYKAQLYSILDLVPSSLKLQPRVASAIMLNILGGAKEESHDALVDLTHSHYHDDLDIFLHLYGKSSKPGRKIGHITVVSYSPEADLEKLAAPLIKEVDVIRQGRLDAASAQLRPTAPATSQQPPPVSASSRDTENPLVVVTMGSDSDLHVLKGAFEVLERFRVPYDFTITSAHRTPHKMSELAKSAVKRGIRVLIAAAGGAAALPGMLASETPIPVIGVPVKATHLDGQDSLLSIVQMPRGCPVATVAINNSTNSAMLAVRILGTGDAKYRQAMADYMESMSEEVEAKAARLREIGWKEYLEKNRKYVSARQANDQPVAVPFDMLPLQLRVPSGGDVLSHYPRYLMVETDVARVDVLASAVLPPPVDPVLLQVGAHGEMWAAPYYLSHPTVYLSNLTPTELSIIQPLIDDFNITEDLRQHGARDDFISRLFTGWDGTVCAEVPLPTLIPHNPRDSSCAVGNVSRDHPDPNLHGAVVALTVHVRPKLPQPVMWELKAEPSGEYVSFGHVNLWGRITEWDAKWNAVAKYDRAEKHRVWRYNRDMTIALARQRILAHRGCGCVLGYDPPLEGLVLARGLLEDEISNMGAARRRRSS
ncbi:hypothetical protein ACJZ2D_008439 [Fusarium nematophilum]